MVLIHELSRLLDSSGLEAINLSALRNILANGQARSLSILGQAFGHAFLFSLGTIGLAFFAALFLPRQRFESVHDANTALMSQR